MNNQGQSNVVENVNVDMSPNIPARKGPGRIPRHLRRKVGKSTPPKELSQGDEVQLRFYTKNDGFKTEGGTVSLITESPHRPGTYNLVIENRHGHQRAVQLPHKSIFVYKSG